MCLASSNILNTFTEMLQNKKSEKYLGWEQSLACVCYKLKNQLSKQLYQCVRCYSLLSKPFAGVNYIPFEITGDSSSLIGSQQKICG